MKEPGSENEQVLPEVRQKERAKVDTRNSLLGSPRSLLHYYCEFLLLLPKSDIEATGLTLTTESMRCHLKSNVLACWTQLLNIQELCMINIKMFVV